MKTQTSEHSSEPKTALITGASRGIGKATARLFAQKGYRLYITCCNSMKELESTALKLQAEYHISCIPVRADMGNYEDVKRLFSQISSLDVLVNNAGTAHIGLLTDMTVEEWHRVLSVNLDSCFYTCKCAIPLMLQKHSGRIINVSSVWGNVGASMETAYSASKGGVNSFTKALAKELAPQQYTSQCRCLRRYGYRYEPLSLAGGYGCTESGNSCRPAGRSHGGGKTDPTDFGSSHLHDRTDYNNRWRMVLSPPPSVR